MKKNIIFLLCLTFILSACGVSPSDITNIGETKKLTGIQQITQVNMGSGSDSIPEPGRFDPKVSGVNSYYPIMTPPPVDTGAIDNSRDILPPSFPMLPPR